MLSVQEMDDRVSIRDQLSQETGPVILINTFKVAPEDADALLEAWAADAAFMKQQPGFISTQLHRGVGGSSVFLNYAVWESMEAFRAAFTNPKFQATFARYPDTTVASPHLSRRSPCPASAWIVSSVCASGGRARLLLHAGSMRDRENLDPSLVETRTRRGGSARVNRRWRRAS